MRLELEPNQQLSYANFAEADATADNRAAEAAQHLREGIKAAQSGNRPAARASLLRAAELDPRSESAWLWLSSISEYPEELLAFLSNVLDINPSNARALEWAAATRSLLARNLVQRGIDAAESRQTDMAVQHFNQALEHDERNSLAWLWLASLADSNEGKVSYFEKVLEFDPDNDTARTGIQAARNSIREGLLKEARAAAVAGRPEEANQLLDAVIAEEPDAEDAWVLRSHLATDFDAKAAAFRRVLEINPENAAARAGLESITFILDSVGQSAGVMADAADEEIKEDASPTAPVAFDEQPEPAGYTTDPAAEPATLDIEAQLQHQATEYRAEGLDGPADSRSSASFAEPESPAYTGLYDGTIIINDVGGEGQFDAATNGLDPEHQDSFAASNADLGDDARGTFDDAWPSVEETATNEAEPEELTFELAPETPAEDPTQDVPEQDSIEADLTFGEAEHPAAVNSGVTFFNLTPLAGTASNPFNSEAFSSEPDAFKTLVSLDQDPEFLEAVQTYAHEARSEDDARTGVGGFDVPFDATMYGANNIPRPDAEFVEGGVPTGLETRLDQRPDDQKAAASTAACSYCGHENDSQAISCNGCLAVLTLADLELILANHHADKALLRTAVEEMERERMTRDLSEVELTTLGIGHLNLRNLQFGFNYLQEASQRNPNNVVLAGQVNALLIRLDEIRRQDENHESMTRGKTILVVDDSPTVRKLIAGKLEKCGHDVFCANDGVEAMDMLAEVRPDLILLDINMPRMDGYQACKLIRGNDSLKDVPVVMISGKDGFFDKVRGRMAGTSGYITKPFGPETLMKAVESYLRGEA